MTTRTARVEATPEISKEALAAAVYGSGYKVVEKGALDADGADRRDDRAALRRLLVSAAFTIPLVVLAMGPHVLAFVAGDGMGTGSEADPMGGMDMGAGMEGMDMGQPSSSNMSEMMAHMDMMDGADDNKSNASMGGTMHGAMMNGSNEMDAMPGMMDMDMSPPGAQSMPAADDGMDMAGMGIEHAWLQWALATPVVAYGGLPFFQGAWRALRARSLTMDSLVAVGMGTAYGYSTVITVMPAWASSTGLYFETAAVIVTLVLLGRHVEARATRRARAQLDRLLTDEADATIGQFITADPGARQGLQRAVDQVVRFFVPGILIIAAASFTFWLTLGAPIALNAGLEPQSMALLSLITVLIIACPCALGLAIPLAATSATIRAAEQGIFLKAASSEGARRVDTVVLGADGILTEGAPKVTDVVTLRGTEGDFLKLAVAAAAKSPHPNEVAIHRSGASIDAAPPPVVESFVDVAGQGGRATVDGKPVLLGRPEWLASQGIEMTAPKAVRRLRAQGKTVLAVAAEGVLLGLVALHDPVRPEARPAIESLRFAGYRTVLLTGEDERTARALAEKVGVDEVLAAAAPAERAAAIRSLQRRVGGVAVIAATQDDAPALAEANLGITVAAGHDDAKKTANVLLAKDDLSGARTAIDLARHASRKGRQNLAWAFAYNALLIPVAAGLLVAWPILGRPVPLDPMLGAAAMTLSILSVVANSLAPSSWLGGVRALLPRRVLHAQGVPA